MKAVALRNANPSPTAVPANMSTDTNMNTDTIMSMATRIATANATLTEIRTKAMLIVFIAIRMTIMSIATITRKQHKTTRSAKAATTTATTTATRTVMETRPAHTATNMNIKDTATKPPITDTATRKAVRVATTVHVKSLRMATAKGMDTVMGGMDTVTEADLQSRPFRTLAFVPQLASLKAAAAVSTAVTSAALFLVGAPALLDVAIDLAGFRINIHVLMTLAAFALTASGAMGEGVLLLLLFAASHTAEERLTMRARRDLDAMNDLIPDTALVVKNAGIDGATEDVEARPVSEVRVDMLVLVRAGEMVPLDGVIVEGEAYLSVEHLTGEAAPALKVPGDEIAGGSITNDGALVIRVTQTAQDSTPARLQQLTSAVHSQQRGRPQLQRWLDRFNDLATPQLVPHTNGAAVAGSASATASPSGLLPGDAEAHEPTNGAAGATLMVQRWLDRFNDRYSQVVLCVAAAILVLGPLLLGIPLVTTAQQTGAFQRALGFMVAAAPCALSVTPLAYVVAVSACARAGVLVQSGDTLDALTTCRTIAFDKTGTLTTGRLVCSGIV
ncbi:cadmium/zinc-transporting ATPase, partial [Cymbomonas tetramitiformis]